jgi:hypothetical protein
MLIWKPIRPLFLALFILGGAASAFADAAGYSEKVLLREESANYIVIHFHDWSSATHQERWKMISTHQDPFTAENNYAYLRCINKRTQQVIFQKPCPALTRIAISKDERYIAGISDIKLRNPYQMVVFSVKGELIKKRHIGTGEASLSANELAQFQAKFREAYARYKANERIYRHGKRYFIDHSLGPKDLMLEAFKYLVAFEAKNHLSDNFSQSITNWIFWFSQEDPQLRFVYRGNDLFSISLKDPSGQRFEIPIREG